MKGIILAIFTVVLVGRLCAAFPKTATKVRSSLEPGRDLKEVKYTYDQELVSSFEWRELLEHIPDSLFPILEKILKGIARSRSPEDIIKAILTRDWKYLGGKKDKRRRRRKNKKDKKKKEEETEEEGKTKEPKEE